MFENFVGLYKLSKTLRFELKPVGRTLEHIRKSGVLDRDFVRAAEYTRIKEILDGEHRALLERSLGRKMGVDWTELASAYDLFRKSEKDNAARDVLENATTICRKKIVESFHADEMYDVLTEATPSKFIKRLMNSAKERKENPERAVEVFSSFACYFTGYQENRKNIYSEEKQATAAANRAVNENFPRFLECCTIFGHLVEKYPDVVSKAEAELGPLLGGDRLKDFFSVDSYSKFLPQSGIERFNGIVGGFVPVEKEKIRGVNEFINLLRQQNEGARSDRHLGRMPMLYKQILSDRGTLSFVNEAFERDLDVLAAIKCFDDNLVKDETLVKLYALVKDIKPSEGIFLDSERLTDVSKWLCGNWSMLRDSMRTYAERLFGDIKADKKREKEVERWLKKSEYSLAEVSASLGDGVTVSEGTIVKDVGNCWRNEVAKTKFAMVEEKRTLAQKALSTTEETGLSGRSEDVAAIKDYLDAVQDVLHFVKPLNVSSELNRDMDFYGEFDLLYAELDKVVPLYNRVRNYITKKPSEVGKMKLMFDCSTIGEGWEIKKESERRSTILERDGQYFLAIIPSTENSGRMLDEIAHHVDGDCYRKMVYKQIPNAGNYFSVKQFRPQDPPQYVLDYFEPGKDKKLLGKGALTQAIKYVINDFIPNYKPLQSTDGKPFFNFKFKQPDEYESWKAFCDDVCNQAYLIRFEKVSAKFVDDLVACGKLYLFKMHNKDFSAGATGRENLHTIYWRKLFEKKNLDNLVIKLCGGAELFYRQASIKRPFVHAVGEKMINRRDRDGKPIEDSVFGELFAHANGRLEISKLSVKAKSLLESGKVVVKDVKHAIVKDARYAEDKFFFHVPIMINARAADKQSKFNDLVNAHLRDSRGVNVIGIDRGERHLLYVTVVNPRGEILEQRSFNVLEHETFAGKQAAVDYHAKLDQSEKARDAARRSWQSIGKIKDLKAGYLSVVVHEIARMMLKYNAVVALEDLNFGFKRGRFAIEKQVYQKFEKALIDKLNYLVFKDIPATEPGGALKGFQLTDKFVSFERLGKQTGFVYYVPAAYTSKIDPTTGFTNLFDMKKCTNAQNIKDFFGSFDSICYVKSENAFAFAFDYANFKTRLKGRKTDWVVYSGDRRLAFDAKSKSEKEIFPTRILLDALAMQKIPVEEGFDLKAYLQNLPATRENAAFFKTVLYAFDRTLQMRNSCAATGDDYIHSPVKNADGVFFDSRSCGPDLPQNADANGAYHIALKGLWIVTEALHDKKPDLKLEHETWFAFAQSRS